MGRSRAQDLIFYGNITNNKAPILANVTVPMGEYTNIGNGSVLLKNMPGLKVGGGPVTSWLITNVSSAQLTNTCTTPTANQTARTPTPSNSLGGSAGVMSITLNQASYTMNVQAFGPGGASNIVTLTYTRVLNALNVGDNLSGADADNRFATGGLGPTMGGKTLLLSVGYDITEIGTGIFYMNNTRPSTMCTVRNADNARPARIFGLDCPDCQFLTFDGLVFIGKAERNIVSIRHNGTACNNITVRNCSMVNSSRNTISTNNNQNNHAAVYIAGSASDIIVEDNTFIWICRCISVGPGPGPITIRRNKFRYYHADGVFWGSNTNLKISENVFMSPMRYGGNTTGSPDHNDAYQFGDGSVVSGLEVTGNYWIQADGNAGITPGQAGQTSSTGMIWAGNVLLTRGVGSYLGNQTNARVRENTIFLTGSGLINQGDVNASDNIWYQTQAMYGNTGGGGNIAERNFAAAFSFTGWTANSTNKASGAEYSAVVQYTTANNSSIGIEPQPVNLIPNFSGNTFNYSTYLNYTDARERLDNYHASNNPNGTNYPNMTIDEIVNRVKLILTPKPGGILDLGDGITAGAVDLTGSLKSAIPAGIVRADVASGNTVMSGVWDLQYTAGLSNSAALVAPVAGNNGIPANTSIDLNNAFFTKTGGPYTISDVDFSGRTVWIDTVNFTFNNCKFGKSNGGIPLYMAGNGGTQPTVTLNNCLADCANSASAFEAPLYGPSTLTANNCKFMNSRANFFSTAGALTSNWTFTDCAFIDGCRNPGTRHYDGIGHFYGGTYNITRCLLYHPSGAPPLANWGPGDGGLTGSFFPESTIANITGTITNCILQVGLMDPMSYLGGRGNWNFQFVSTATYNNTMTLNGTLLDSGSSGYITKAGTYPGILSGTGNTDLWNGVAITLP